MDKAKKPRKKATNGYKMPDPIPKGEILTDVGKKQWRLGTSIGKGGFGEIYSASEASSNSSKDSYVIKVEPHGNGPLFVEMHFYMKNAKQVDIDAFIKTHKLSTFGMPSYLGSGSHEIGYNKYRFIVLEKFGTDIDKLRKENKGLLPANTVFQLAWQITYVLEYIHGFGYVHADIKGGNVLLGISAKTKNQAYLVDFGLATKFTTNNEFKPNPKKAHDGTIEYLSRDAHYGVPTRRGDFEILGYNIIHWLGGSLPWDRSLNDLKIVQQMKEDNMKDIPKFVKTALKKNNDTIVKFLKYVDNLKFNEAPDYKKIRSLFETELERNGSSVNGPLEFTVAKKRSVHDVVEDKAEDDPSIKVQKPSRKREKRQKENEEVNQIAEVMTDAMKEVLARKQEKEAEKKKKVAKKREKVNGDVSNEQDIEGYTAEMLEMHTRKTNKEKKEKSSPQNSQTMEEPYQRLRRHVPIVNYEERKEKVPKRKTRL